jgi:hypothetical protein
MRVVLRRTHCKQRCKIPHPIDFIPEFEEDGDRRPNLEGIVAEDGCFAGVALCLDLVEEVDTAQSGEFCHLLLDIRLVGLQLVGLFRVRGTQKGGPEGRSRLK